jgi:hypothetical protein
MHSVGNNPPWKELPADIAGGVLSHTNPLTASRFSVVCKQWNQAVTSALESPDQRQAGFAFDMFSKMPKVAKNKIFGELHKILKPTLKHDYWKCAEDAFYGNNRQSATNSQKAKAIRNYLNKLSQ